MTDKEKLDARLAEILDGPLTPDDEKWWSEGCLAADIRQSVRRDPINPDEGETHEEQALRIMKEFVARALTEENVSTDLLYWAAKGFEKFLNENVSLDDAFNLVDRRKTKHEITERKRIDIVSAYRQTLDFHRFQFKLNKNGVRVREQVELSKDALIEAERNAYIAYHDGKEPASHVDWERQFNESVKKYLEESGDFIPRSTVSGRGSNTKTRK